MIERTSPREDMRKSRAWLVLTVIASLLAGCNPPGADHVKSLKSDSFASIPRNILAVFPQNSQLKEKFRTALATSLAGCGTTIHFISTRNPELAPGTPDAILTGAQGAIETTTETRSGAPVGQWLSKVHYDFTLNDVATHKNVWVESVDFIGKSLPDQRQTVSDEVAWAQSLFEKMQQDGLVGACDPAKAVPVPTQLTYLPNMPPMAKTTAQTAPSLPMPPPRMAAFTVHGKKYATVEAALEAIRQIADEKVAKAVPIGRTTYPSLLVIMPAPAEFSRDSVSSLGNKEDFTRFLVGASEIQSDAYIKAFRKTALFEEIETARSDEIASGDFRGHAYKLWFTSPGEDDKGSWVLASAKGGERRFQLPISDHVVDIGAMLMRADFALDNLPR